MIQTKASVEVSGRWRMIDSLNQVSVFSISIAAIVNEINCDSCTAIVNEINFVYSENSVLSSQIR
jgi:hypothetical protein